MTFAPTDGATIAFVVAALVAVPAAGGVVAFAPHHSERDEIR
ncbi:MAG: hypothetical protein ACRDF0_04855 [Candidatus Limnocylindria bacterium]